MSEKTLQLKVVLSAFANGLTRPFAQASGATKTLRKDLAATRGALKGLERQQSLLNKFGELKARTGELSAQLAEARAKATALGRAHAAVEQPTRKMTAEFKRARQEVDRLEREQREEQRTLNATRRELNQAGLSTRKYADHQRDLKRRIDQTNATLDQQKRKLADADRQASFRRNGRGGVGGVGGAGFMGNAARVGATATAVGYTVGVPALNAARRSADLTDDVTTLRQTADLPRAAAPDVRQFIVEGARRTNQHLAEYGDSLKALVGKGLDIPEAEKLATIGGLAATAYKGDASQLAELNYALYDNLKIPVDQMARVQDGLTQAGKMGSYELDAMSKMMPGWTGAYATLGAEGPRAAYDLATTAQIVRRTAQSDDQAGNNLSNLLAQANSNETKRRFKELGIDSTKELKRASAEGRSVIMELAELTERATGGDTWRMGELFGDRQASDSMKALLLHKADYEKIFAASQAADGVVQKDFIDRQEDPNEKARKLLIEKEIAESKVGDALLKKIEPVFKPLTALTRGLGDVAEKYPEQVANAILLPVALALGGGSVAGGFAGGLADKIDPKRTTTALALGGGPAAAAIGQKGALALWRKSVDQGLQGILDRFASFNPLGALIVAFNPLETWFIGLPSKFFTFGANAVQGFIDGLRGKSGEVSSAAGEAAGAASKGAKDKLQIKSPSRVFAGLGEQTMAGLSLGIRRGAASPLRQAAAVAAGLAGAMGGAQPFLAGARPAVVAAPPLARAGSAPGPAAAPPAGPTYHITINPPPGADPKAIADAVAAELDRRDRQAAARRRSSYSDYGDD